VIANANALATVVASATAMSAVAASAVALNAIAKNDAARASLAGSSHLQTNATAMQATMNGNTSKFTKRVNGATVNGIYGNTRYLFGFSGNDFTYSTYSNQTGLVKGKAFVFVRSAGYYSNNNNYQTNVLHMQTKAVAKNPSASASYTTTLNAICVGGAVLECTSAGSGYPAGAIVDAWEAV
jgi:hypothetical protein